MAAALPDPDLEQVWRQESGRVLATLIGLLGDFDTAEEALHDAFAAAARQWPRDGVPRNPRAWLVSAGRFKAIDRMRNRRRLSQATDELARDMEEAVEPDEPQAIVDDRLRLIFVCCHPALPPDAQVAMTLREVCGLTTEAIAAAFLTKPATLAQRIVRAKARITDLGLPYSVPEPDEFAARMDAVLHAIYLIFNEGYAASSGETALRLDLCAEAIRLARLVRDLTGNPDATGLLALLLLGHARRAARTDAAGDVIVLEDQDRSLWDRPAIAEGIELAREAFALPPVCAYTIEAAIAAAHVEPPDAASVDRSRIVQLYDLLMQASPSPLVELNRAVAVAMRDGPEAGLADIERLATGPLAGYRYAHAARADLLRRLGQNAEAAEAYRAALALTQQLSDRRFIARRLAEVGDAPPAPPVSS